jgi:hypothetical protein
MRKNIKKSVKLVENKLIHGAISVKTPLAILGL